MNSDLLQFKGQLAATTKMAAENSFLPPKHGRKNRENLSLSQLMGGGVLFL